MTGSALSLCPSTGRVIYLDTSAGILAHQVANEGTHLSERSAAGFLFHGHPEDHPNFFDEDVRMFGRWPVRHGKAGRSKLIRELLGPLGWTFVNETRPHPSTLNGFGDNPAAKDEVFFGC
jgi:hypothetical protein